MRRSKGSGSGSGDEPERRTRRRLPLTGEEVAMRNADAMTRTQRDRAAEGQGRQVVRSDDPQAESQ